MNKKQIIITVIMVLAVLGVFVVFPPYKLASVGGYADNYIKTKIGSSLFKRCQAPLTFEWQKIIPAVSAVVAVGGLLIFSLRERKPKEPDAPE